MTIPGKSADGEKALFLLNLEVTPKDTFHFAVMSHSFTNVIHNYRNLSMKNGPGIFEVNNWSNAR